MNDNTEVVQNGPSQTPESVVIKPRDRHHVLASLLAGDWFGDRVFATAWFNSMSITFPQGEKFFIDSVRHYSNQVSDRKLRLEIAGFCGQEGFHRREHQRFNETLCSQRYYDLGYLEGRLEKNIARANKLLSPLQRLAATAGLEHITAIMAEWGLAGGDNTIGASAPPAMAQMWDWHAAEELEHKSVAFDVYRLVGGDETMRRRAMRRATFFLLLDVTVGAVHMLRHDGKLWRLATWCDAYRLLLGNRGLLRQLWPAYRQYFQQSFHPWDRDTQALLQRWQQQDGDRQVSSGAQATTQDFAHI